MTEKLDMGAPDCQGVEKETNVPLFFLRDGAWVRAGSSQTPVVVVSVTVHGAPSGCMAPHLVQGNECWFSTAMREKKRKTKLIRLPFVSVKPKVLLIPLAPFTARHSNTWQYWRGRS